jgi:lipopolysaccharide/colanic/teichoic acid biosynthesis glycosyltransferase
MDKKFTQSETPNLLLKSRVSQSVFTGSKAPAVPQRQSDAGDDLAVQSEDQRPLRRLVYIGEIKSDMRQALSDLRYDIWEFSSCQEAHAYFETQHKRKTQLTGAWTPFGLLCDWNIPKGSIRNWAKDLRAISGFRDMPIIALANNPGRSIKAEAVKAGLDDVQPYSTSASDIDAVLSFWSTYRAMLPKDAKSIDVTPVKIGFLKRTLDILVAGSVLLALSPVLLLVALLIKIDSPGPIFYISKRVGAGYKIFNFYKFRSMRCGADKELEDLMHLNQYANGEPRSEGASPTFEDVCLDCISEGKACESQMEVKGQMVCKKIHEKQGKATFIKIENDPRVTPFGRFIRKTSIDELPQLFNVLKGDMSIVGNRPLPTYEAEVLTTDKYVRRFMGPAGITGLWQVTKRGGTEMSEEDRINLDIEYAERHNFWYDLGIMIRTIPAMIQKEAV